MTTASKPVPATGKQIAAPLQSLIGGRILALREQRVMPDTDHADLAKLYAVQTKRYWCKRSSAILHAFRKISCLSSRPMSSPL
jgi:hypothetical protein